MEKQTFESDKVYSTYWWVIKLDPKHPANYNQRVTEITGYSKRTGHDEAKDKIVLLMKKIIMLHSRGYFDKSFHINIYMKEGEFLNKQVSKPLIQLTKTDYSIHEDSVADRNFYQEFFLKQGLINFLTRFYNYLATGKDVKSLLPNAKATFSKDDYLDPSKHTFKIRKQLYAYCEKLIKNSYPYEAVLHFQRKYEENNPFLD